MPRLLAYTYSIVSETGEFWNGYTWVKEYSKAKTWEKRKQAFAEATTMKSSLRRFVFQDYGLESEESLLTVSPKVALFSGPSFKICQHRSTAYSRKTSNLETVRCHSCGIAIPSLKER